jgi:hypothetical protein
MVKQAKELQLRKQYDIGMHFCRAVHHQCLILTRFRTTERWLDAYRSQLVYHAALSKALPGTCQWIIEDASIQRWVNQPPSSSPGPAQCLWIYSRIPGAGKTVAASRLVQYLKEEGGRPVAYYFASHESSSSHGFSGIVRSWILQLSRAYGWDVVEAAYDQYVEHDKPMDVWAMLRSLLIIGVSVYLVLDGLDEVEDRTGKYATGARGDFVRSLLATVCETTTRVLIVSRYEREIEDGLSSGSADKRPVDIDQIAIRLQQTAIDLRRVAEHRVSTMFPTWTEQQRDGVIAALVTRADGMFVLLQAILEQLGAGSTYIDVQHAVAQPLTGNSNTDMLQQAYRSQVEKLLSLPPATRDFCLHVLLWIQQAVRPLRLGELLDVLRVLSRNNEAAFEVPRIESLHDLDLRLLRHCPLFISLRGDAGTISDRTLHLAHFSVKEFLQYTGSLEKSNFAHWKLFAGGTATNTYLSKACLRYLLQTEFSKYPAKPVPGASKGVFEYREGFGDSLKRHHMFYDYAASFWWRHLDLSCSKPDLVAFLDARSDTIKRPDAETDPMGVVKHVEQLLEVLSPSESKGYEKFLPLDIELQNLCHEFLGLRGEGNCCNYKIWRHYRLRIWDEKGDDYLARARDSLVHSHSFSSPEWAAEPLWRCLDIYMWQNHLFSTYGNRRKLRLQERLVEAMCMHSTALTAILAEEGADINFVWPDHRQTLSMYASGVGGVSSSGLFFHIFVTHFGASTELNKPVMPLQIPVNGTVFRAGGGGRFNPRVLWAFLYGNVLQRLVLSAWRFEPPGPYSRSDLDTIRTMISFHIEVNNRSLFFPSAAHAAALNAMTSKDKKIEMLKTLFANGADANVGPWLRPVATFVGDASPVRETLWEMLLQLLPSNGVSEGRTFGSLLTIIEHDRSEYYKDELISAIITKQALSCNSAGWVRHEKLQLAVRRNDVEEVKHMLDSGVNVNKCGTWYGSALYVSAYTGKKDLVELLLDRGADPNIAVETRILPLELEEDFQWSGLWCKSLAKNGVLYSPLQAAARNGHNHVVQLLLDRGAEVNRSEGNAGSALYFAVRASLPRYLAAAWAEERNKGDRLQYWCDLNDKDRAKSLALITMLIKRGADVNQTGGRYWTALQAACVTGEPQTVVYLLKHKADPNIVGGQWGTALQAALVNHPDAHVEAVEHGGVYDPDDPAPAVLSLGMRIYGLCVLLFQVFPFRDLVTLAKLGNPTMDVGALLAYALLEYGADPTVRAGPWGTAIHAAAFYGSWPALEVVLKGEYSTATARREAANYAGWKMGVAINGAVSAGRWDKVVLLLRHAGAGYSYMPLLRFRARKSVVSTFHRVCWVLEVIWALSDALVMSVVMTGASAVCVVIWMVWDELDRKAKAWDPRLAGLWMLVSVLGAGYVANLRQTWAEDSAW